MAAGARPNGLRLRGDRRLVQSASGRAVPAGVRVRMTEVRSGLRMVGFADQREFEDWLAGQPPDAAGLWIKFAKKGTGKANAASNAAGLVFVSARCPLKAHFQRKTRRG